MNILYLAHRIPYPPNKGDKIRSFHQIKFLAQRHRMHVVCLVDDPEDLPYVQNLREYCQSVDAVYRPSYQVWSRAGLGALFGQSLSVGAFYSSTLQKKVDSILRSVSIDRIIVFSSPMAEYVRRVVGIPKLMDFVDVDSEKWLAYGKFHKFPVNLMYNLEGKRLAWYEKTIAKEFDSLVFISDQEAELFRGRVENKSIAVIRNGVDLDYFQRNGSRDVSHLAEPSLVFTAAMDYFPNVDAAVFFCQHIFSYIRKVCPSVRFDIVGRKPTAVVRALEKLPNVHVTGTVPDVRPYLHKGSVAVAPFRIARGVQNKVLEAMAASLPVVGTSCAFQGIQATPDDGIKIADEPVQFAEEVLGLLRNEASRQECGLQAQRFVQRYHRWNSCLEQLDSLIQCLGSNNSQGFGNTTIGDSP